MSEKTFGNVSSEIFDCMKSKSQEIRGTVYDPPEANQGTATTKISIIGTIVLSFDFDPSAQTVTYKIVEIPGIVPESSIWDGIQEGIDACSGA